jgi:hypothetical protein
MGEIPAANKHRGEQRRETGQQESGGWKLGTLLQGERAGDEGDREKTHGLLTR